MAKQSCRKHDPGPWITEPTILLRSKSVLKRASSHGFSAILCFQQRRTQGQLTHYCNAHEIGLMLKCWDMQKISQYMKRLWSSWWGMFWLCSRSCESLGNFAEWSQNREDSNTLGLSKTVLQAALHWITLHWTALHSITLHLSCTCLLDGEIWV